MDSPALLCTSCIIDSNHLKQARKTASDTHHHERRSFPSRSFSLSSGLSLSLTLAAAFRTTIKATTRNSDLPSNEIFSPPVPASPLFLKHCDDSTYKRGPAGEPSRARPRQRARHLFFPGYEIPPLAPSQASASPFLPLSLHNERAELLLHSSATREISSCGRLRRRHAHTHTSTPPRSHTSHNTHICMNTQEASSCACRPLPTNSLA